MINSTKILVVDDDTGILKTVVNILSRGNFEVTTAAKYDIAVKYLECTKYDLLLTDSSQTQLNSHKTTKCLADIIPNLTFAGKSRPSFIIQENINNLLSFSIARSAMIKKQISTTSGLTNINCEAH